MGTATINSVSKVGIDSMDENHQEMFDELGGLEAAMKNHAAREEIGALLKQLAKTTHEHFTQEEAQMKESNFNGLALHVLKHEYLRQQMDALLARFERGGFEISEHTLLFLRDWLNTHIQKEDLLYALWQSKRAKN
jgi:hemerythrin-like metal-binding protein